MNIWVVGSGNPFDGMKIYGPFASSDDAMAWAEGELGVEDWWVIQVEEPITQADREAVLQGLLIHKVSHGR